MTVRVWELASALFIFLIAAVFLLGGQPIEGAVAAALGTFWLVGRANIPQWIGYGYVRRSAAFELIRAVTLCIVLLAAMATTFVAWALGWNRDPEGPLLFIALGGVMVLLRYEIERRFEHFDDLARGGDAEAAVGSALDDLDGFEVEHNWLRPDGFGNVDHIAHRLADGASFAIETKSGWFRTQAAAQAVSNALAVKKREGVTWVTAVVCVGKATDPVREHRHGNSRVWIVRRDHLAGWLPTAPTTQTYFR